MRARCKGLQHNRQNAKDTKKKRKREWAYLGVLGGLAVRSVGISKSSVEVRSVSDPCSIRVQSVGSSAVRIGEIHSWK